MHAAEFQLSAYLRRIGLPTDSPLTASVTTVQQLMVAQLRSIPFENLDVQAGYIVSLEPADIVKKILGVAGEATRGGYCYEVNALFAMALTELGIPYQFVFCRPMFYPMRRPKTHMALIVQVEGQHLLCDLGFGSYGLRAPIALASVNQPQVQDYDRFQLRQPEPGQYVLQADIQGEWVDQYGFDLYPAQWIDFAPANYLNSTHPDTIFVQKVLVIRQHAEGRVLLVGNELKRTVRGQTQVEPVIDLAKVLLQEFALVAPAARSA